MGAVRSVDDEVLDAMPATGRADQRHWRSKTGALSRIPFSRRCRERCATRHAD
jgi:hypothetical protein